jgi:hypothetical protein
MAKGHAEVKGAVAPMQVVSEEAVECGLEGIDVPARGPGSSGFDGRCEIEQTGVGCRSEHATGNGAFDRRHGAGGAPGELNRGQPPNPALDGGIVSALKQVGRLFDRIEDQVDPAALRSGALVHPLL